MNDEAQIARLFRRHGDVVAPDDLGGVVSVGLREQLEVYHTLAGEIDCVFLADMTFNAVAISDGTRYAIGINIGAAVLIARYAYCLMSDPTMFPNIGDPSGEEVDPYVIECLRNPLRAKSYGRYLPRNPTRLEAAKQLSLAAYLMLFFHELNHVELGHLDLAKDRFGVTEYREITAVPISTEEAAARRALELEADMAALYRSLQVWRTMYALFDQPALAAVTPEDSWFHAVELLFWIMDFVQPDSHVGRLATHPSPMARRLNVLDVTSAVDWVPTMNDPSPLIPWIRRNRLPSPALTDPLYGNPDRAKREVAETGRQLVELLPTLDSYRRFQNAR